MGFAHLSKMVGENGMNNSIHHAAESVIAMYLAQAWGVQGWVGTGNPAAVACRAARGSRRNPGRTSQGMAAGTRSAQPRSEAAFRASPGSGGSGFPGATRLRSGAGWWPLGAELVCPGWRRARGLIWESWASCPCLRMTGKPCLQGELFIVAGCCSCFWCKVFADVHSKGTSARPHK